MRLPWRRRPAEDEDPVDLAQWLEGRKRFRRTVRTSIREFIEDQREAPPLMLWASKGEDPRHGFAFHVGAAEDALDVKARIVEGLRVSRSHFGAVGRLLQMPGEDGQLEPTAVYGLAVFDGVDVEMWEADAVAGRLGPWRESLFGTERDAREQADQWAFAQQVIRTNVRAAREGGARV